MSGFNFFNGTYRRTPTVSIRGNSKSETREELLERAQKERLKREVSYIQSSLTGFYMGEGCRHKAWVQHMHIIWGH